MSPSDVICPVCGSADERCVDKKRRPLVLHHPERARRAREHAASILVGRMNHRYQLAHIYEEHARCDECGAEPREPCVDMDETAMPLPCDGRELLPVGMTTERAE